MHIKVVIQMTKVYERLKLNIEQIESGLGIDKFSNQEILNNIDAYQVVSKAYVLLVHAELEKYFEVLSVMIAKDSFFEFDTNGKPTLPLLSLTSSNLYGFEKQGSKSAGYLDLKKRVNCFFAKFVALVKENNGIKAKNVSELFWILGFSKDSFGDNLLSLLDSYGIKRGAIAHTGSPATKQLLNIKDEQNSACQLIKEIGNFDIKIEKTGYITGNENIDEIEAMIFSNRKTSSENE